jgi:hypothetical protein
MPLPIIIVRMALPLNLLHLMSPLKGECSHGVAPRRRSDVQAGMKFVR